MQRIHAALQKKLVATKSKKLFYFFPVFFYGCNIFIFAVRPATEITEFTLHKTHIGNINISVDLPCNNISGMKHLPYFIGNKHKFGKGPVAINVKAFFKRNGWPVFKPGYYFFGNHVNDFSQRYMILFLKR